MDTPLLTGLLVRDNIHLIIGTGGPLSATRCSQSLAAGARPILIAESDPDALHPALRSKIDGGTVCWENRKFSDTDVLHLGRPEVDGVVDAVFITARGDRYDEAVRIAALCRRKRIPINVVDAPFLCTFTLLSVHADGPLLVGVTTSGNGCKSASRIRRDIAASLPSGLGSACARLGEVRRRLYASDPEQGQQGQQQLDGGPEDGFAAADDDSLGQDASFNSLVTPDHDQDVRRRKMRWLAQVCEYWPLGKLATLADDDVDRLLATYPGFTTSTTATTTENNNHKQHPPQLGTFILAGSGPGHPSLLTRADLDLIPRRVPLQIARKFPGNADRAQEELLEAALAGVRAGRCVLRLKQGDPFLYGRGGEEIAWFGQRGLAHRVSVLPGVTSALSAPLFAGIPVTQRDVADQVLICTGTGKRGKPPKPPGFVKSRTVVFLMALHRIGDLVAELTVHLPAENDGEAEGSKSLRALWPATTPCAVVERASCPDQRVIRTTLAHVAHAVDVEGSRPPGLLVVGAACEVLHHPPDDVPDGVGSQAGERGQVGGLGTQPWRVEEGFRALDHLDAPLDLGLGSDVGCEGGRVGV